MGGNRQPFIAIPVLTPDRENKRQNGRRFKNDGEDMFTLTAQDRHGVLIKEATKKGYAVAEKGDSINLSMPSSKTRRGRVGKGVANTLDTSCNQGVIVYDDYNSRVRKDQDTVGTITTNIGSAAPRNGTKLIMGYRIRKLTPRECFRLQGWEDEYFDRAAAVNSDSQLYKQAGNQVTVNVIYEIGKRME